VYYEAQEQKEAANRCESRSTSPFPEAFIGYLHFIRPRHRAHASPGHSLYDSQGRKCWTRGEDRHFSSEDIESEIGVSPRDGADFAPQDGDFFSTVHSVDSEVLPRIV
jgi:hypothetical protein